MINKNLIGKKIQDGRIKKNLTQEQLAEAVEISSNYLSKVERGLNMMSADVLLKTIEILELRLEDFEIFQKEKVNNLEYQINHLLSTCNEDTLKIIIPVIKAIIEATK